MLNTLDIFFARRVQDRRSVASLTERSEAVSVLEEQLDRLVARLDVAGLHLGEDGGITVGRSHIVELSFPPIYPVETGPIVRFVTPSVQHVHPNVDPVKGLVCWGLLEPDRWAPSIGVDDVLLIVARMLRLEIYNLNDIVSGAQDSAAYVAELASRGETPLDGSPLWQPETCNEIAIDAEESDDVIEL